jgi:hypothetical protein
MWIMIIEKEDIMEVMNDSFRETIERLLQKTARGLLITRAVESAATGAIAGSLVASVALAAAVFNPPPFTASWFLIMPLLGAFVAAAGQVVKGVSTFNAGIFLDSRYNLFEQMSMSAELSRRNADSTTAACIYRQAAKRAESLPKKIDYRSAGTKTVAFVLLSITFCLVLYTAAMSAAETDPEAKRLYKQIAGMNESRRAEITNAIPDHASAEVTSGSIEDLKHIVEVTSQEEFDRILEKLRRQGIEIKEISKYIEKSRGSDPTAASTMIKRGSLQGRVDSSGEPVSIPVFVGPENATIPSSSSGYGNVAGAKARLDNGSKWQKTKRSASRKLREEDIEKRYRPIIRAFFLPEG